MMNYTFSIRLISVLLLGLVLTIIPIPHLLAGIRPPWVLLVILYIQFYIPTAFNLVLIVSMGLCLDVLLSTLLGEHVLALVITTWIASTRVRRFHLFALPQQMALITLFCCIYEVVLYLIDVYQGYNHSLLMVLGTTLISLMLWPWASFFFSQYFHNRPRNRARLL
jgi:rod shape-determining protein MreD